MVPAVAGLLEGAKPCTDCADYSTMMLLQKHMPHMRHAPGPFQASRMVKDDEEIRTLQKASHMIDGMFELCAATITLGQTESQLQATLMSHAAERELFDTGYPSTLNPLIVAGGPNGALPHAQVTGRRFERGDLVVVDITLRYRGYVSDATRTFGVGHVSTEHAKIYDIVKEAQELGLRAASDGVSCGEVDRACRDHIESRGYGSYFIHSTGHGVGLEVHEQPAISKSAGTILRRDMAVTVEPGIYVPGEAGVRIEDSIIVGRDSMHRYTKDLVVV
jgi:Xaa-Pro aminopeptidase/Xaa-Pro dipeptidase